MKEMNENWTYVAPLLLDYKYTIEPSEQVEVSDKIRRHYLGDEAISKENFSKLVAMVGDRTFNYDAEKSARAHARVSRNPVMFYYYSYRASMSLGTEPSNSTDNLGVKILVLFL